jgi:hypothetical protein
VTDCGTNLPFTNRLPHVSLRLNPPFPRCKAARLHRATSGRSTVDAIVWIETHIARGVSPKIEMWAECHVERLLVVRPALIADLDIAGKG